MDRYNSLMKVVYIASSLLVLYYMRLHRVVRQTYDRKQDTFRQAARVKHSRVPLAA